MPKELVAGGAFRGRRYPWQLRRFRPDGLCMAQKDDGIVDIRTSDDPTSDLSGEGSESAVMHIDFEDWLTVAVIVWIESPLSASISNWPLILSFSKNVGSDLDDLALLKTLSVIFPSATWKTCSVGSRRKLMG